MKTLIFQDERFQAEKIVKTEDSIYGYINNKLVFSFEEIKNFSVYRLDGNQQFDMPQKSEIDSLKEQIEIQQELINKLINANPTMI